MLFDKLSLFVDGKTVPTTASTDTYSKVLDLRLNGNLGIDGELKVYGQVVGTANSTGSVTTVVQTSADGTAWTDVASQTQDGNLLIAMFLPFGLKRFVRLKFSVGETALGSAIVVKAGLVDQFDLASKPSVQSYPPLADLNALGDLLAAELKLSASSGTIVKGSSGTVTIASGMVSTVIVPSDKYTVTVSGSTITIALAAGGADGTVTFVDGLGNKVAYAVTAANS